MAKLSQKKLKEVLIRELKLKDPSFELEKLSNNKISGSVISDSFLDLRASKRQKMIWDALDREFGSESTLLVGTLLAYTEAEWNVDLAGMH